MSTDLHPNPEDVWVLARENSMLRAWLLMMSCLDSFQKPSLHPHLTPTFSPVVSLSPYQGQHA